MAYEPLAGWVQVTRVVATGEVRSHRFHADQECARRWVGLVIQRASKREPVESYLSAKMPYGEARRFKSFSMCKCAGGRGRHPTGSDRRFGEVQAGSQGTGRRR